MTQEVDTEKIIENTAKTYTITKDSTAGEIFEAAQAFVMDHAKILAGGADAKTLSQFQQFVMTLKGVTPQAEQEMSQQIVNPADTRVGDDDNLDQYFDDNNNNISLKIGGLNTSWSYDYKNYADHAFDQVGAAQRLSDACQGHVIYDIDRGRFAAWNGKRWVWLGNDINQLTQLSREILDLMVTEAGVKVADTKDTLSKIESLRTQPKLVQIIKLTQTEDLLGTSNIRYNYRNDLINCENGEINIKTGELLPHDKSHMFTRIIPFEYHKDAHSDLWDQFLNTTFQNDQKMIDYLQIALGDSSLSGVNTDRHMYVVYGSGHDGKSVALSTIRHVLGGDSQDDSGFSDTADINSFLKKRTNSAGGASPDMAALDGKRFITPTEPDNSSKLDEGLIKSLTGKSDTMKVRQLYSTAFTLYTQFSLWIAANEIPKSSASQAIMDRMVIIPFTHRIKPNSPEDMPNIEYELSQKDNAEGVLAWLVAGSVKANQKRAKAAKEAAAARAAGDTDKVIYQDPLMPYPDSVQKARNQYQYSANSAMQFIYDVLYSNDELMNIVIPMIENDKQRWYLKKGVTSRLKGDEIDLAREMFDEPRLVYDDNGYISKNDLYEMYKSYCSSEGITKAMTKRRFHDTIATVLAEGRQKGSYVWLGVSAMPYLKQDHGITAGLYVGNLTNYLKHLAMKYDIDKLAAYSQIKDNNLFVANIDNHTTDAAKEHIKQFIDVNPSSFGNKYRTDYTNIDWPESNQSTTPTNSTNNSTTNTQNTNQQQKTGNSEIDELNALFGD